MTTGDVLFWLSLGLAGYACSGLFSGLETGIYSLSRVRLHVYAREGWRSAKRLDQMIHNPNQLLATLLIGNNIANNLASSATGILLEQTGLGQWQVIGVSVLVVTPLLFIFAETLPKDLFAAHADRWVYPFAALLHWLRVLFFWIGALPLIGAMSGLTTWILGGSSQTVMYHPRHMVGMLVREGVGKGLLSDEQSAIVERVLRLAGRTVGDEMQPWDKVTVVRVTDTPAHLWELADQTSLSRFPVVAADAAGDGPPRVLGVLSLYDALWHDRDNCPSIESLMTPVTTLPAAMPLRDGLAEMQRGASALSLVTDDAGQPIGIVTIKDLVEPITGELASW